MIRRTALLLRRLKARVLIWERWPLDVGSIVLSGDLYAEGRHDDDLFAHVLSDDLSSRSMGSPLPMLIWALCMKRVA